MPESNKDAHRSATRERGRPAGSTGLRETILNAARAEFGRVGYDRATMRQIASTAGVDASLISHYFGSKARLFTAAVLPPFDPREQFPILLAGDPDQIGLRVADFLLRMLSQEQTRTMILGAVRAAGSEPAAAEVLRETLTERLFAPLASTLGTDQPDLRAALLGSQSVGLVFARYVVGLDALREASDQALATAVAPVFQHYLVGDLGGPAIAEH